MFPVVPGEINFKIDSNSQSKDKGLRVQLLRNRGQRLEFTQSCRFDNAPRLNIARETDFASSLNIIGRNSDESDVNYYRPPSSRSLHGEGHSRNDTETGDIGNVETLFIKSKTFEHNISNTNVKSAVNGPTKSAMKNKNKQNSRALFDDKMHSSLSVPGLEQMTFRDTHPEFSRSERFADKVSKKDFSKKSKAKEINLYCTCEKYHSHTFTNGAALLYSNKQPYDFEQSLSKTRSDLISANEKHYNICNTFWRPSLSMNSYVHGDAQLEYTSLWQSETLLMNWLRDAMQNTILKTAILELALLSVIAGPLHLLKCLINLKLVSKYKMCNF